jgi:4-amino-4-deoxy-L-arabinose transferase-like glycosyltransferase
MKVIPIRKDNPVNQFIRQFKAKVAYWPLVVLLVILISFHLFTLFRTPAPHVDEAWNASRTWGFIKTGLNFGPLDSGVFDRFDGYWTFFPTLVTWIYSLAVRVLGPTLLSVRITSLSFGLILLVAVYAIADHLYGRMVGLLSVLLVALSNAFLFSSHLGRQDIIVAAIAYCAFALYIADDSLGYSRRSILSGLAASLAFEVHPPIGMIVVPALGLLYILDFGFSFIRLKRFWGFVSGAMVGFAFYAILHVIPYPHTYTAIANILTPWRTPPILTLDPSLWLQSVEDLILLIIQFEGLWIPLLLIAFIALLIRRSVSDNRLLKLFIVVFTMLFLLIRYKLSFYAIVITPLAGVLVAVLLITVWSYITSNVLRVSRLRHVVIITSTIFILCYLVVAVAFDLSPALANPMNDYEATVDRIQQVVPAGSSVMGPQTYWFGLVGQPYISWEQLVFYQRYTPGTTLDEAFTQFHPQFFIVDKHLESFIADDVSDLSEHHQFLYLPEKEFQRFLSTRGKLITTIDTETLGSVRIYRINWH